MARHASFVAALLLALALATSIGSHGAVLFADAFIKVASVLPNSYKEGDRLPVAANALTSLSHIMKMGFYTMPWCQLAARPDKAKIRRSLNIGQILAGDQIEPSLYEISMRQNRTCQRLWDPVAMTADMSKLLQRRVEEHYRGNLMLDGLPVYEQLVPTKRNIFTRSVATGFPVGTPAKYSHDGKTGYVHNHLAFVISVHDHASTLAETEADDTYRVVGFRVSALSVDHRKHPCDEKFNRVEAWNHPLQADAKEIEWTYSVEFEDSDVEWGSRLDILTKASPTEARVHWMSIVNSLCVVILLSVVIAVVLIRVLRRDFERYNTDPESLDEDREETGWKLVHGDVFRSPENPEMLAIYIGTGMQLVLMIAITLVVACFGLLSPANRGALLSTLLFVFVLLGCYNGYTTARYAKFFKVKSWRIIFLAAFLIPGQFFMGYILLNFVHWGYNASTATPFVTILTLFALWTCVSLPLVLLGGALGYRQDTFEVPCKVKLIARAVPPQPWYLQNPWAILLPGILPFGAAFVEALFILTSMWQGRIYYMFGFLGLVFIIMIITCAEATILMTYFQLVNHDYRWWWRAFLSSGSYGILLFLYSIVYYVTALSIRSWWSSVLYFGYMFLVSYFFFILTGTIGFVSALMFVKKIYGSIKVE